MVLAKNAVYLKPGLLTGYLAETARRVAASHARQGRRRHARERHAAASEVQELQTEDTHSERLAMLQSALAQIRPEDRELIRLRYFGAMKTTRQLAESLGVTHNAVKQRLSRIIRRLRQIARRMEAGGLPREVHHNSRDGC